jgi:hypothetical protein
MLLARAVAEAGKAAILTQAARARQEAAEKLSALE